MNWNSSVNTSDVTEAGPARESRSFGGGDAPGGSSFGQSSYLPAPVLSGVAVTPETALTFAALYACILALSTDLASLPREVKRRRPGKGTVPVPKDPRYDLVYCEPNRNTTSIRFWQHLYGHRFGWGNGYAEIKRRGGMPVELHLHSPRPTDTWPERSRSGSVWYQLDGGRRQVRAEDVLHIAGFGFNGLVGYSPVALHRQGVGYGMAMEQQGASFYGNAMVPRGALKVQKVMTPEAFRNLRESMSAVHAGPENANRLLILEEGMSYEQISVNPVDAEYLAGRRFQLNEMCRIFQVPGPRVQDYLGVTGVYKAFDDLMQSYVSFTLGPEIEAEKQWVNRVFFTRRERAHGLHLAHDWTALSRGNLAARTAYYKARFEMHSITPDEVREREGDNPTGTDLGKEFFVGSAYKPASLSKPGPDPDPPPADGPAPPPEPPDGLADPGASPGEEGAPESTTEIEGNRQ